MSITVGQVAGKGNAKRAVCLMAAQAANLSAPTGASQAGAVPNYNPNSPYSADQGACFTGLCARESTLMIYSPASASLTGIFTLWGFLEAEGQWFQVKVNGGSAVAAASGTINYAERFSNLGHFDQLYLQVASIGGGAVFDAWLATGNEGAY